MTSLPQLTSSQASQASQAFPSPPDSAALADVDPVDPLEGWNYAEPLTYIGTSDLMSACRCMRLFFYRAVCKLTRQGGDNIALKFGEAIHRGLPSAIAAGDLKLAMEQFNSVWQERTPDDKRNKQNAVRIYEDIMDTVGPGATNPQYKLLPPPEGTLKVADSYSDWEIPFRLQLPGCWLPIRSRIDGWCTSTSNGQLWALEYKTASSIAEYSISNFDINVQGMLYPLVLRLFGYKVEGTMFHHILVSKTQNNNLIKPVFVPDFQLESFMRWLTFKVLMIQHAYETKTFPQDWSGCYSYGMYGSPSFPCSFQNACLVPDWTRMSMLFEKSDYRPFREIGEQVAEVKLRDASVAFEALPSTSGSGGVTLKGLL